MGTIDQIILAAGALSLLAVIAGIASVPLGAPLSLGLIAVGMLAGEDGPGGIRFDDFRMGYLIGSVSLAVILFQGGISTERWMLKSALGPAVTLATAGVALPALSRSTSRSSRCWKGSGAATICSRSFSSW